MAEQPEQGSGGENQKKRKWISHDEAVMKVKRTIGWYNHNGGLTQPIIYKDVKDVVEAVDPRESLKILATLEEKAPTIRNPTAWLRGACEKVGPELDIRVKKTITWLNKNAGLQEEIRFDEVKKALAWMDPSQALKLLKGLDGKQAEVRNPTSWICAGAKKLYQYGGPQQQWGAISHSSSGPPPGAMSFSAGGAGGPVVVPAKSWAVPAAPQKGSWGAKGCGAIGGKGGADFGGKGKGGVDYGLDKSVARTIGWYNKNGGLQSQIIWTDVAPALSMVGTAAALQILKGLDGKGPEIRNPSAWVVKAAQKMSGA